MLYYYIVKNADGTRYFRKEGQFMTKQRANELRAKGLIVTLLATKVCGI